MDIQKLQKEKNQLAQEVANLQGELNKIKSNIINKKNDEKIVKIGYLKQNIDDLNRKIEKFKGIHSRNTDLRQEEKNKKLEYEDLEKKITKLKEDLESSSKLINLKNIEVHKQTTKNSEISAEIEKNSIVLKNLLKEDIFVKQNLNKTTLLEISAEYARKTSGTDPFFILAKSEEQKEKLENKLKELQEYYDQELNSQMELIIPQKLQEKEEILKSVSELDKKKKIHDKFAFITSQMNGLEEEYEAKKAIYREKQEVIKEIEEELETLKFDNVNYEALANSLKNQENYENFADESIEKVSQRISFLEEEIKKKENNYRGSIRTIKSRIAQMRNLNTNIKIEINSIMRDLLRLKNIKF